MRLLLNEVFQDPTPYVEELQKIPIPPFLSVEYDRPSKEEVIARRVTRFSQGVAETPQTVQLDTPDGSGE